MSEHDLNRLTAHLREDNDRDSRLIAHMAELEEQRDAARDEARAVSIKAAELDGYVVTARSERDTARAELNRQLAGRSIEQAALRTAIRRIARITDIVDEADLVLDAHDIAEIRRTLDGGGDED